MTGSPAATSPATDPASVLARWEADEAAVRARMGGVGVVDPAQAQPLTGLQLFAAMVAGELPQPPMGDTLGFLLVEHGPGFAVFQGRPQWQHYNPMGSVHGGWFATLLDSAMACAVHTTLPVGKRYTTAELKINIVRPLTDRVPRVRAEGRVIHGGQRMATADGRLIGPDGRLYAHASTTCFIFE